jgi:hypothetical protein
MWSAFRVCAQDGWFRPRRPLTVFPSQWRCPAGEASQPPATACRCHGEAYGVACGLLLAHFATGMDQLRTVTATRVASPSFRVSLYFKTMHGQGQLLAINPEALREDFLTLALENGFPVAALHLGGGIVLRALGRRERNLTRGGRVLAPLILAGAVGGGRHPACGGWPLACLGGANQQLPAAPVCGRCFGGQRTRQWPLCAFQPGAQPTCCVSACW